MGLKANKTDPTFYEFESPHFGIRALAVVLKNYGKFYDIRTIEGVINRWAPPHENPTEAYVNFVAKQVGLEAHVPIDLSDPLTVQDLVKAIIAFENGSQPYSDLEIAKAVRAAGIS